MATATVKALMPGFSSSGPARSPARRGRSGRQPLRPSRRRRGRRDGRPRGALPRAGLGRRSRRAGSRSSRAGRWGSSSAPSARRAAARRSCGRGWRAPSSLVRGEEGEGRHRRVARPHEVVAAERVAVVAPGGAHAGDYGAGKHPVLVGLEHRRRGFRRGAEARRPVPAARAGAPSAPSPPRSRRAPSRSPRRGPRPRASGPPPGLARRPRRACRGGPRARRTSRRCLPPRAGRHG